MTFQSKLDAALQLIEEYNASISSIKDAKTIDGQKFIDSIKLMGNISEQDLGSLKWENILQCFIQTPPLVGQIAITPFKLAQKIAEVWREPKEEQTEDKTTVSVSAKKAHKMSVSELVQSLDPEEPDSPVAQRLNGWAKGKNFIVYKSGREIDVDETVKQITALKAGHPPVEITIVNSSPKKVYCLGELPDNYADENPLYPGRPLRPDGTCDQSLRSWDGIPLNVRQFVRVALNTGNIKISKIDDVHQVLDIVLSSNINNLKTRYPAAAIKFEQLEKVNQLPNLQIPLVNPKNVTVGTFDSGKKVVWTTNNNYYRCGYVKGN